MTIPKCISVCGFAAVTRPLSSVLKSGFYRALTRSLKTITNISGPSACTTHKCPELVEDGEKGVTSCPLAEGKRRIFKQNNGRRIWLASWVSPNVVFVNLLGLYSAHPLPL